ncbi:MAG: RusA family crossover junction endodeoxyribonuclease [Terriglobia bacterium]
MKLSFTVYGHPEPQGSMRAFVPKGWVRPVVTSANPKMKPWRQQIARTAAEELPRQNDGICDPVPRDTPVFLRLDFYLGRPASLPKKYQHATKRPDWDKLCRAVCDSLTGSVITDDSQIVMAVTTKNYGVPERVEIFLATLRDEFAKDPQVQRTLDLFATSPGRG